MLNTKPQGYMFSHMNPFVFSFLDNVKILVFRVGILVGIFVFFLILLFSLWFILLFPSWIAVKIGYLISLAILFFHTAFQDILGWDQMDFKKAMIIVVIIPFTTLIAYTTTFTHRKAEQNVRSTLPSTQSQPQNNTQLEQRTEGDQSPAINTDEGDVTLNYGDTNVRGIMFAPVKGKLYIRTYPSNATIRILNIIPKFSQGIKLDPGSYFLEVSAEGYVTYKEWITLKDGEDKKMKIGLRIRP
jgi:hypothetical protein